MMTGRRIYAVPALLVIASLITSPVYAQNQPAQAPEEQTQTPQQTPPPQYQPPKVAEAAPESPTRNLQLNMGRDYSKSNPWFPNFAAPYTPMHVAQPDLTNTPRINQLISNGKLMLSLEDVISLGLENNLAIAVEQYVPWLDQASLLLAKSGANGKIAFDPTITGTLSLSQTTTPINNPFFGGTGSLNTGATPAKTPPPAVFGHTFTANTQYTQGFATGTQAQVTFDNSRSTSSIPIDLFNPANQSTLTIQITQPLLNGFGRIPNTRYILEAKNTIKVGESQFAQQVITTVTQVATDYWELVFARENVKVEQVAVAADQQLYENNKKQLEIGTMAPLDVITAQSQLATDQQALVQAQTTQLLDETTLLVAITKDPLVAQLTGIEIVPTTPIFNPAPVSISLDDAVQEAWKNRPELQQAELNLKNAGIEIKATKNALLPTVNLFGQYSATGLGGIERKSTTTTSGLVANRAAPIVDATGAPVPGLFEPSAITAFNLFNFPGGYGDDLNRLFNARYPTFEGGINFTLPIRNRAAEAANATAQLNHRQQLVQYRQTQSTIVLNVRQTLITLEQDRAAIAAAEQARTLQQQSYDDEVKRLQLGTSTAFTVIQKQQLLTAAEGVELRDRINLIEAELNFNQAMGRTLDVHHIIVAGAGPGSLYHTPNIPGTPDADGLQAHQ
ncbi:MAG TPA: TolC family protein [Candidatus Acidoferrales bacterium]|nr:TolC family protein [Candidatus Acidoferrales bacterium]